MQERVLLRLVETVDLVEEQDRASALGPECPAGIVELVSHVLHAGVDRRQRPEPARGVLGEQAGHRRLARPGRSEEHRRAQPVVLDEGPKRRPGAEEVALADDLVEARGAKAGRERCPGA